MVQHFFLLRRFLVLIVHKAVSVPNLPCQTKENRTQSRFLMAPAWCMIKACLPRIEHTTALVIMVFIGFFYDSLTINRASFKDIYLEGLLLACRNLIPPRMSDFDKFSRVVGILSPPPLLGLWPMLL